MLCLNQSVKIQHGEQDIYNAGRSNQRQKNKDVSKDNFTQGGQIRAVMVKKSTEKTGGDEGKAPL